MSHNKIIGIVICIALLFSYIPASFAAQNADPENSAAENGTTSEKNVYKDQWRINYMDEVERYDYGDFSSGSGASAEKTVPYKNSIDLLNDIGIFLTSEDREAVLQGKEINTTAADYDKYRRSITETDLNYILKQIVDPGTNITQQDDHADRDTVITMGYVVDKMVDLLGYYIIKTIVGSDKLVSDESLLSGIDNYNAEKYLSLGEFAAIAENTLNAYGVLETTYTSAGLSFVKADETLMERKLDIYKISGFMNGIGALNIFKNAPDNEKKAEIDRKGYLTGKSKAKDYFGKYVNAYFYEDKTAGENIIRHIETNRKDKSAVYDLRDIEYKNNRINCYHDDSKNKSYDINNISYILYNGVYSNDTSVLKELDNTEGTIMFAASENEKYDTVIINAYSYYMVKYIDSKEKRVYLKDDTLSDGNDYIDFDDYDEIICLDSEKKISSDNINVNEVIRVISCRKNKYIYIAVSGKSVTGMVQKVNDENIVVISGKEYRIAYEYLKNSNNESITVQKSGKFYLSDDGLIVGYKNSNSASYAYMRSCWRDESGDAVKTELFTQQGEWAEYTLNNKNVILDGNKVTASVVLSCFENNSSNLSGSPVRYKINADNEITFLDTLLDTKYEIDDKNRMKLAYKGTVTQSWHCEWFRSDNGYRLRSSSTLFELPQNKDRKEEYSVRTASVLNSDENDVFVELYNANEVGFCDLVIVSEANTVLANEVTGIFFCERLGKVYDDKNDENCYAMKGKMISEKGEVDENVTDTLKISASNYEKFMKSYPGSVAAGTLMNYSVNSDGYVTAIEPYVYNAELPSDYTDSGDNAYYRKFVGKVDAIDTEEGSGYFSVNSLGTKYVSRLETPIICIDAQLKKVSSIPLSELREGERIFVLRIGGDARFAAVVR